MYTVTFYSYRGGVGRTTALVNVAMDLALRGRKVLLVDFDLESPSLPSFSPLRRGPQAGLVEFIDEYLRRGKAPDVADFIYTAEPVGEDCGEIRVMPAGRGDDEYWRAFHQIDWQELYDLQDGFVLFEDLKYQLEESFRPDYVLIDARAGINDRVGICTRHLPDAVVMFFTPDSAGEAGADDQAGFHRVLRDILTESLQSSPPRIDLLTVASKVPDLDGEAPSFSMLTEIDPLDDPDGVGFIFDLAATIPHAPEYLLDKQVIPAPRPRKGLHRAYRRLANALIRSNCTHDPEGARAFLKELQRDPERAVEKPAIDLVDRWFDCTAHLDQVINNFGRDPEILAQAASCLFLAGRLDEAMRTLDQAIDIGHPPDSIRWQRASYRRRLKDPRAVNDLLQLLDTPAPSGQFDLTALLRMLATKSSIPGYLKDPDVPELDTESLDTADPLTRDFPDINPYVASAIQHLRQLAPESLQEALRMPRVLQLAPEARRALVEGIPALTHTAEKDPRRLIRARQWRHAIALLETHVTQASSTSPEALFHLAMAYWGTGNEVRATELCRTAREALLGGRQPALIFRVLEPRFLQQMPLLSLMFWKAGDRDTAEVMLDRCEEFAATFEGDALFSIWRYQAVTRHRFQGDCVLLRRMIRGEAIRPHFLGKEPGSA